MARIKANESLEITQLSHPAFYLTRPNRSQAINSHSGAQTTTASAATTAACISLTFIVTAQLKQNTPAVLWTNVQRCKLYFSLLYINPSTCSLVVKLVVTNNLSFICADTLLLNFSTII